MPPKKSKKPSLSASGLGALQPFILGIRWRNSEIDRLFYDVGALTIDERVQIAGSQITEGGLIVVPPRDSSSPFREFDSPRAFVDASEASQSDLSIDTFVIAGIGNSALGCTALARNVADHLGRSVAAIVSRYGVADVVTEALGGWFDLGLAEDLRGKLDEVEQTDATQDERDTIDEVNDDDPGWIPGACDETDESQDGYKPGSPESRALLWLLCDARAEVNLLVGHSKGSLSIANALRGYSSLCECSPGLKPRRPRVVTIGAAVRMPQEFDDVHQFLGELDWYGQMNSQRGVTYTSIEGAWHHVNSQLPLHLSVEAVLQRVARRRPSRGDVTS